MMVSAGLRWFASSGSLFSDGFRWFPLVFFPNWSPVPVSVGLVLTRITRQLVVAWWTPLVPAGFCQLA